MPRLVRWLPWVTGIAALAVLVYFVLHVAEERAFLTLLEQSQPRWVLLALVFQAFTYLAQAEVWRLVLHRAGTPLRWGFACRLSLAKLFMDQAIPSMGLSGAVLVTQALEQRGAARGTVLSSVSIDATAFYLAYIVNLAVALALLAAAGHAVPLILALGVFFLLYCAALAAVVLVLSGRRPGRLAHALLRVPGLRRILAVLQDANPRLAHDPALLSRATALQILIAVADAATLWALLRALGVDASAAAVFSSFLIASVLRSIGVLPGGLGTFEAGSVGALTFAGVPIAAALSATLMFRAVSFWLPMLPGLAYTRSLGRSSAATPRESNRGPYWALQADALVSELATSATGLTGAEAARRLAGHGPNVVGELEGFSRLGVLWNQLRSPLLLLLLFAAATSMLTGEWVDAAIVIAIVVASVAIGYTREYRAQSAAAELSARVQVRATLLRDGVPQPVPVRDVVPGDVALLSAGSIVPGDSVLLDATDCFVNEAVLTGESFPVQKIPGAVAQDTPLAKRFNCLHLGTSVRSGTARCLIVATGAATSYGAVAHRLQLRPPETEFDRGIRHFGYLLTTAMTVMMVAVLVANLLLHRPLIETLLFAIALAVGLSPELLPAILSVNLARGAHTMSEHGVLVRHLNAIENLGSMDVLCTDKTGTLTEGVVQLDGAWDDQGRPSEEVLQWGALNAALQSGLVNPLDEAILQRRRPLADAAVKVAEVPYDFVRKRLTVVVRDADGCRLLTKGAFEQVLAACTFVGRHAVLDAGRREELRERAAQWTQRGIRVLAVATREVEPDAKHDRDEEQSLTFAGFLTFLDRPKDGVDQAIADLQRLGVAVKVITGDSGAVAQYVAARVGLRADRTLSGAQLDELHDEALWHEAERTDLFVEVDPNQKERIILALKKTGHVVGFLGDGINDAPAMHAADTSLSVQGAVDVAREAADFVLLERDLDVIRRGIEEGRRTFANTLKYVMTTTSANLGNMISMAVASLFLPFLPLLAGQILLNNFLSDVPAVGIADDSVDPEMVDRPRRWNMKFLGRFMVEFGCLSSLFDFLTFALLLVVFVAPAELFRTGWFIESLLTELVIALVVRTRRPFWRSRPGTVLLWSTAAIALLTFAIPYLPYASLLGFTPLPFGLAIALVAITVAYVAGAEVLKASFYRRRPHPASGGD
ncbi:MAG TPA: magnesium-translocating P-type ATPase [Steroidobacteraceae bacterium]